MNNNNTWVKRSEREPGTGDVPVVYGHYRGADWIESSAQCVWPAASNLDYTHWRSIKCDPPPRELTQRERDEALARNIAMVDEGTVTECVLEGIYAERRELSRLMDELWPEGKWGRGESYNSQCKAIRARLDEQGGGM